MVVNGILSHSKTLLTLLHYLKENETEFYRLVRTTFTEPGDPSPLYHDIRTTVIMKVLSWPQRIAKHRHMGSYFDTDLRGVATCSVSTIRNAIRCNQWGYLLQPFCLLPFLVQLFVIINPDCQKYGNKLEILSLSLCRACPRKRWKGPWSCRVESAPISCAYISMQTASSRTTDTTTVNKRQSLTLGSQRSLPASLVAPSQCTDTSSVLLRLSSCYNGGSLF